MQKTPITIDAEYDKMEKECEELYTKSLKTFAEFCEPFTTKLNEIINPKIEESKEEVPAD